MRDEPAAQFPGLDVIFVYPHIPVTLGLRQLRLCRAHFLEGSDQVCITLLEGVQRGTVGQLGIESIWCTIYVRNDYQPHTIEAWADNIAAQLDAVRRLTDIVRQCRRLNILSGPEGDDNAVRLVHKTGDEIVRSAERTAVELLCDPMGLGTLMREWLATPDASVIPRHYAPAD